ncbi:type II toxin-antitoxin system RelE family toxin [Enterococcus casseliflavus]|uniref:type II toxin-antitoxin system RelE family toxin n=1 Tax=Enterococcus casseliflavus TaxID=37734 RepID=UPI00232F5D2E|nr:type II toxin-antitoxin system RelE/ParE family toxin [Enterococcus casseliflavus]MDB1689573.1 type II toxin-antitoxin system RelE/ParE family toxin [Enterococcus casseliflavus]
MKYHVEFDKRAQKESMKLDTFIRKQILLWMNKNIEGCENPRWTEKALNADKSGLWRYRIGKYRLICDIRDDYALVLVIKTGKREMINDG